MLSSIFVIQIEVRSIFSSVSRTAVAIIYSSVFKVQIVDRCIFPSVSWPVDVEKEVIKYQQQHKAPEYDPCRYLCQVENNTNYDHY